VQRSTVLVVSHLTGYLPRDSVAFLIDVPVVEAVRAHCRRTFSSQRLFQLFQEMPTAKHNALHVTPTLLCDPVKAGYYFRRRWEPAPYEVMVLPIFPPAIHTNDDHRLTNNY
jgi:hypothetical protein